MTMQIIDCEQNSPEWFQARLGRPTASKFATVLARGSRGGESKTRRDYLNKLAGEIITGQPMDSYSNGHMERGHELEEEARDLYAFMHNVTPQRVGFVVNGRVGASPDSFVGDDGLVEIKTALPHILIDEFRRDRFPTQHIAQCQGQMWVTERAWCDLAIYSPGLPLYVKRVEQDTEYVVNLRSETNAFLEELDEIVEGIRGRMAA